MCGYHPMVWFLGTGELGRDKAHVADAMHECLCSLHELCTLWERSCKAHVRFLMECVWQALSELMTDLS